MARLWVFAALCSLLAPSTLYVTASFGDLLHGSTNSECPACPCFTCDDRDELCSHSGKCSENGA
ncbi:hypothetical protein SARC_17849, partial [Sphaeroforma arctica JP610]